MPFGRKNDEPVEQSDIAPVEDAEPVMTDKAALAAGAETSVQITGDERRSRQSRIDKMRDLFASQPKVQVRLSEDTRVQINGYTFNIKGKTRVMVPESVAEVLDQSGRY